MPAQAEDAAVAYLPETPVRLAAAGVERVVDRFRAPPPTSPGQDTLPETPGFQRGNKQPLQSDGVAPREEQFGRFA